MQFFRRRVPNCRIAKNEKQKVNVWTEVKYKIKFLFKNTFVIRLSFEEIC